MDNFQQKISPILKEMHDCFWEDDLKERPNDWSDDDMASAAKIFVKVLWEKMYIHKYKDNHKGLKKDGIDMSISDEMPEEELQKRMKHVEKIGKRLRDLVYNETGLDLHKYYK